MRDVTRKWCAIGVLAGVVLIAPTTAVRTQEASSPSADLATLLAPGAVLQDRNGDGVIDFVNARLLLGDRPGAADVSAAADLAARFGFETMAMNLPLSAAPAGAPTFIVGRAGLQRAGGAAPAGMAALGPGDGIVAVTGARSDLSVIVAGTDNAGTMAAAELLAGRLPHVWDPKGPTLGEVAKDVRGVLTAAGIAVSSASVTAVSVRAGGDEIRTIDVSVAVPAASVASATAEIKRVAQSRAMAGSAAAKPSGAATKGGARTPAKEKRPAAQAPADAKPALSYPGAAMVRVSSVYQTRVVPKISCPTWCVATAAGREVAKPAAVE